MKALAISLVLALAATACTIESEEDQLENAIRNNLSSQGNVLDVQITRQDDNNFNGFAELRDAGGNQGRLACTAQRRDGSNFNWRCLPTITEEVVQDIENQIRAFYAQRQVEVVQIDLARQDDMRMTGNALLRDPMGNEAQANCEANRVNEASREFRWRCNPA